MTWVPHIVVVDDEPDLRLGVQDYLQRQSYRVSVADGAESLRALLASEPADLVILDVRMPGEDGIAIARQLRSASSIGIIMLTSLDDTVDRIVGLEIGADDYVAKPFDPRELLARVRSVLRRTSTSVQPIQSGPRGVPFGRCRVDLERRRVEDETGREVQVTGMEFNLIEVLLRHPDQVLSRDRLLDLAHRGDAVPFDRSIDVRIARLRAKIEVDPAQPQVIRTVHGMGYVYVPG